MERVIGYVDGFNLYFGLKSKGWGRYYWLNIQLLVQNLLKPNQKLLATKYFTARIANPPDKQRRQSTYIEALETLSDFQIFYGKYQLNPRQCSHCGFQDKVPNEKMTDVNIAVEILKDAYQDNFDVALLISADSDLVPPIKTVRELFPNKRVVIASPPARYSVDLVNSSNKSFVISRRKIAKSLLPEEITKEDDYILRCPPSWK
ncbi:MAG: NYN domain-containing protein [Dehalococcoidia bacterium]|nr:NYN domain-containing protein [Dehalococcoidia bacterium]